MANKKEDLENKVDEVVETPAKAVKSQKNVFEVKDSRYTSFIVNGKLVNVIDGKIAVSEEDVEAIKDYVK